MSNSKGEGYWDKYYIQDGRNIHSSPKSHISKYMKFTEAVNMKNKFKLMQDVTFIDGWSDNVDKNETVDKCSKLKSL
jgi:hypothetical protein